MLAFLKRVYMNGVFNEVVLEFDKENVFTKSLDYSTALFSYQKKEIDDNIEIKNCSLGIQDLNTIIKYLSGKGTGTVKFSVSKDNSILKISCGRSYLRYLVSDPSTVITWVKDEDAHNKVLNENVFEINVTEELVKEVPKLIQLTKSEIVSVVKDKNGVIKVEDLSLTSHGFSFTVGKATLNNDSEIHKSEFNSELFSNILKTIDTNEEPILGVSKENHLSVSQNNGFWVLLPMES